MSYSLYSVKIIVYVEHKDSIKIKKSICSAIYLKGNPDKSNFYKLLFPDIWKLLNVVLA